MKSKLILIVLIGLTSAQTLKNNETTIESKPSNNNLGNNVTNSEINSNSSVIEFFGDNEDKSRADAQNAIQKPNITSKVNYSENKRNKRYRIRNYSVDPLQSNAQSPNPFLSGAPGSRNSRRPGSGIDPQITQLLQNNPRLRLLAEQNPQIAQQILRNPRLLRDPRIANAIRSQLGNGGGLLSLLPGGLGAALNPLGIGLGGGQQGPLGGTGGNQNEGGLFGAPHGTNRRQGNSNRNRANEENIGGGYYGNNGNYGNNPNNNNQNTNNEDNSGANEESDANNGEGGQDYDNAGQEEGDDSQQGGEEGGEEGQEAQDPSQDPANDPDIQQLQNLGGGVGDNFPEGLFPPGLLSKEDLDEIRKQQEKQAKEQAAKERQQQQQQGGGGSANQGGGEGQDYDYGNGEEGNGEDGGEAVEENPEEGSEGQENTTAQEEPVTTVEPTPVTPAVYRTNSSPKYKSEFGGVRQGSVNNPGVEYDEILDVNTPIATPPSVNSIKSKGKAKINSNPPQIPVPVIPYRGQQPVQPYLNPQTGVYQPVAGQIYGQQPQYPQPIQYYPQYQPNFIPPQQYVPQQYPQQYAPQHQYAGQQPGQYPQQPIYQPIPIQQQNYLPQQPIYNQYPQNLNVRGKQQGYNRNQFIRGGPAPDPNIANHNLNTIPHDDSEDNDDYQSAAPNQRLSGHRGRSFQQQPRIFSSSAQNTESSVVFNTTEPSIESNKFNSNSNATYEDIRQRTLRLF